MTTNRIRIHDEITAARHRAASEGIETVHTINSDNIHTVRNTTTGQAVTIVDNTAAERERSARTGWAPDVALIFITPTHNTMLSYSYRYIRWIIASLLEPCTADADEVD